MLAEGKVGLITVADGGQSPARLERTGALVVSNAHGFYTEAVSRGLMMDVSTQVAGVAPGTALSTAPPLVLWNPPSSGKNLSITKATMGYVSGTLGAGSILLAAVLSQVTVPTGGTELTPVNALLGMPRGAGRAFQASTLVSTPQIIRALFTVGAFTAATAQVPVDCVDVIDGAIVVTPGTAIVLQELGAAGTSPLVLFGFTWEEIPV
jgi:hypothetical protein